MKKTIDSKELKAEKQSKADWEEQGLLYLQGKSVAQVARDTGFSRQTVLTRLKVGGFYKNLEKDIKRKAELKLITGGKVTEATSRSGCTSLSPRDAKKVVDHESSRIAGVNQKHRSSIGKFMHELDKSTDMIAREREVVERLLVVNGLMTSDDLNISEDVTLSEQDIKMWKQAIRSRRLLNPAYLRNELAKLAQSYRLILPIERELHGLDKAGGNGLEDEAKDKLTADERGKKIEDDIETMMKKQEEIFKGKRV